MVLAGCGSISATRTPDPGRVAGEPTPRKEPPSRYGNPASYEVFGRRYYISPSSEGYRERGIASWYGPDFHGKRTSSGEPYDMYGVSAAHKHLPIPTYVRVTNLQNGRSLVVRVNDRGPFKDARIIDLSYGAATKLGLVGAGTGMVDVEALPPFQYLVGYAAGEPYYAAGERRPPDSRIASAPTVQPVAPPAPSATAAAPAFTALADPAAPAMPALSLVSRATIPARADPLPVVAATTPVPQGGAFLQVGAFSLRQNAESLQQRIAWQFGAGARIDSRDRVHRVRVGPFSDPLEAEQFALHLASLGYPDARVVLD